MELCLITLISMTVIGAHCDSHSLRNYYTGFSSPGSGLPEYSEVIYVDDREISNYNSDTRQSLPKAEWMKKLEADYWESSTQAGRTWEALYKQNVQTLMNQINYTGGIHIAQVLFGCELRDDGSTEWFSQYGYDGREFMSLDKQTGLFIPTMNGAQIYTQTWNSPDVRLGERQKNYLENECIVWLKKYFEYGREDLQKRVRPEVKVWGRRQSDGATRLQCLVYGFHPRAVDVRWMKNGVDHVPSYEMTPVLPHPDGTYQMRVGVEVPTSGKDTYACHVDHSSLGDKTLIVKWEPDNGLSTTAIVIIVIVIVVSCGAVVGGGIFIYRKRKRLQDGQQSSDNNSDSFNNLTA